jgi:anti-sigma28 factor (negative regulator of flagellin synthesis)
MHPDQPPHSEREDGKSESAEERQERLEELREKVQNGSYEVDSKELAKALIKHHIAGGKS